MITMMTTPTIPIPPIPAASMCLPFRGPEHSEAEFALRIQMSSTFHVSVSARPHHKPRCGGALGSGRGDVPQHA